MSDKPLNGARLQFCREYVISGYNGAEAYKVAYPGCKSGHRQCAQKLLTNTDIIKEISRIDAETRARSVKTREQRQQFWTDMMNDSKANNGDKLRASELLGRSEADFTDNINDNREGLAITVHTDKPGPHLSKEKTA